MNNEQTPFEAAFEAARKFSNPLAQSLLLSELAKVQFQAGRVEDALTGIAGIPNRAEKKGVLLHLALDCVQKNKTTLLPELIRRLIETDPNSASTVGRLALSLLERDTPNIDAALSLLEIVEKPFDADRNRYVFFEKMIEVAGVDRLDDIRRLSATFTDADYRDWAFLALAKLLAQTEKWTEAEEIAENFTLQRRRSWTFFELGRIAETKSDSERFEKLLHRSAELLEAVDVEPENIESVAVQLRILGRFAYRSGETDLGERLLERCEATASKIFLSMPRFRAQYLLARTLRELGLLEDVSKYLDTNSIWSESMTGIQRSHVLQWLAEARSPDQARSDWAAAVREAAGQEDIRGNDFPQAERIVEIVKRYGAEIGKTPHQDKSGDDPVSDAVNLSAEEFEEFYFSPFAIDDCGC